VLAKVEEQGSKLEEITRLLRDLRTAAACRRCETNDRKLDEILSLVRSPADAVNDLQRLQKDLVRGTSYIDYEMRILVLRRRHMDRMFLEK
jgi:hypothetical protein